MQPRGIVIAGSIAIDRIMSFEGAYSEYIKPEKLDSLSVSVFLASLKDTYGGVGANIAYTLALLGDEPFLLGSVGPDAVVYMEKLAKDGVNIKYVHESALATASFNVMTDTDQNQIGGFYPGAMFDSETLSFEPWKGSDALVVVSPHDPQAMRRQVEESKRWSLRLCYDVGQQVSNLPGEDMRAGIETAEVLILNEYELEVLSRKVGLGAVAIKQRVPVVITTFGKQGSTIEGKRVAEPINIGVSPATAVLDPTGAGDAYRAGFLYGYAREWPLKACAQLGAVCGSFAVEHVGTQAHRLDLGAAAQRYQTSFRVPLPEN